MFIVASDLSEAQTERLTSSHSLQGVDLIGYTQGQYLWNCSVRPKVHCRILHSE